MDPARTPVIVAVGQVVNRPGEEPVSPGTLMERAARAAFEEAPGIERHVDRVSVVNILNGGGKAPATLLARRLGLAPEHTETTTIGGNTPQWLVNRAAAEIAAGGVSTTLIAGGEAVRSQHERPELGGEADEATAADGADAVVGDDRPGLSSAELAAGLMVPAYVYPMFESVWARRSGRSLDEQREAIGWLMARFSREAARHPHAWFREPLGAEAISRPGPENRLVAEPYTKRMNAFLAVDQAAAVVVTSLAVAREIGAAGASVFVHAGAEASDVWFPSQRPDVGLSPGIRAAGRAVLAAAGADVDDLAAFDLYSCFPVAVEMACEALGIAEDDARPLTVTGGLPYFGGPGNNYTTHAIASMVERIREEGGRGLVTALGWFVTKHALGVYGVGPPARGYQVGDTAAAQREIDGSTVPLAGELGAGAVAATVDASTVVYDRSGAVTAAPVVATLDDGRRVVAAAAPVELDSLAGVNLVGALVRVEGAPPRFRVEQLLPQEERGP